jgi:nicotinate-nucleotide--dimethylbenzimidazole phosphoribosyltransferase
MEFGPLALELCSIPGIDIGAQQAARARHATLTKPPGSLGLLEDLGIQLAGITGNVRPTVARKVVFVMAADHGVAAEGVSAYPAEVTMQMVQNFLRGGAAITVLAKQASARVLIVDVGVAGELKPHPGLILRKVAYGTRNLAKEPAMTRHQAEETIHAGIELAHNEIDRGMDLVATGEMGIGNTTPSAAIVAALVGVPVAKVTGRGTGVDESSLARKIALLENALTLHRPNPRDPLDVLSKVGGLEIGALTGLIIGAASRRVPVVLDGFIAGAAALVATALVPGTQPFLLAAHQSAEPGHAIALRHLRLVPLLDLGLRLGEGTGAVLAFHLIEASARILNEMATFEEAGVSAKS